MEKILSHYDFDPSLIEIEITETVGEIEKETLRTVIQSLKRLHLRISLDDFGTKYTNLSMLTVADFDVLKLDRSLIQELVASPQNQGRLHLKRRPACAPGLYQRPDGGGRGGGWTRRSRSGLNAPE